MDTPQKYSAAETDRMMKLYNVLLKAIAKKIRWWDAAEIIGVTDRTMRRWRECAVVESLHGVACALSGSPLRAPLRPVAIGIRI